MYSVHLKKIKQPRKYVHNTGYRSRKADNTSHNNSLAEDKKKKKDSGNSGSAKKTVNAILS